MTHRQPTMVLCILSAMMGMCVYAHAKKQADIDILNGTLPDAFRRSTITIFPAIDDRRLRGLPGDPSSINSARVLIEQLKRYQNLRVYGPNQTRKRLTIRLRKSADFRKAQRLARQGKKAFEDVRLAESSRLIGQAIAQYSRLRYQLINPTAVAKLLVMQGQALLEDKKILDASHAFSRALQIDPSYRLNRDLEHPKLFNAFENARISLLRQHSKSLNMDLGQQLDTPGTKDFYRWVENAIYIKVRKNGVDVIIDSPRGLQGERQRLSGNIVDDMNRLASRIFSTLPVGTSRSTDRKRASTADVSMSLGMHAVTPVGPLTNYGINTTVRLLSADGFLLKLGGTVALSGRDYHEHLRQSIVLGQVNLNGGFQWLWQRIGFAILVGVQVDRMGQIEITTNPACKYFSPTSDVPTTLCDYNLDMTRIDPSWSVGPNLALETQIKLFKRISMFGRLQAAVYLYTSSDHEFNWPISGLFGMGYHLN